MPSSKSVSSSEKRMIRINLVLYSTSVQFPASPKLLETLTRKRNLDPEGFRRKEPKPGLEKRQPPILLPPGPEIAAKIQNWIQMARLSQFPTYTHSELGRQGRRNRDTRAATLLRNRKYVTKLQRISTTHRHDSKQLTGTAIL